MTQGKYCPVHPMLRSVLQCLLVAASGFCFLTTATMTSAQDAWSDFDDTDEPESPLAEWEEIITPAETEAAPSPSEEAATTPSVSPTPTITSTPTQRIQPTRQATSAPKPKPTQDHAAKTPHIKIVEPHFSLLQLATSRRDSKYLSKSFIELSLGASIARHFSIQLSGDLTYWGAWDTADNYRYENQFQEALVGYRYNAWFVSLGQQRLEWGGNDNFSPLRALTPVDSRLTLFALDERLWQRQSSFALSGGYKSEKAIFAVAYHPFQVADRYNLFATAWSIAGGAPQTIHLDLGVLEPDSQDAASFKTFDEFMTDPSGTTAAYFPELIHPNDNLSNGRLTLRTQIDLEPITLGLVFTSGYDRTPTAYFSDRLLATFDANQVDATETSDFFLGLSESELRFEKATLVGLDLKFVTDYYVLHFEIAHLDEQTVYAELYTPYRRPVTEIALRIDSFLYPKLVISGAVLASSMRDLPEGAWRKTTESALTFAIKYNVTAAIYPYLSFLVDTHSTASLLDVGCYLGFHRNGYVKAGFHNYEGEESYRIELRPSDDEVYLLVGYVF